MDTEKIFPGLGETDPEFAQIFTNFAFGEALDTLPELPPMDDSTRYLAILATLLGCQGLDAFRLMLPLALDAAFPGRGQRGIGPSGRGPAFGAPGDCAARTAPGGGEPGASGGLR